MHCRLPLAWGENDAHDFLLTEAGMLCANASCPDNTHTPAGVGGASSEPGGRLVEGLQKEVVQHRRKSCTAA
eukprot:scaffold286169_cov16-Tisochrysis_lutea.AAC.2